jgi:type I restriction enzyme S subunit
MAWNGFGEQLCAEAGRTDRRECGEVVGGILVMSDSWTSCTIQDLLTQGDAETKTGPFGTQLHASEYVETGIPVINARNIGFGDIRIDKIEFISEETVQRLSSHLLQPGDIVFGCKGTVERHVFIRAEQAQWLQGTDCLRLRLKSSSIEPRFISYCFLTEFHKKWIINQSSHGATMTSLNQGIIGRIPLRLPPLLTQRKIAAILSAYDDLIENNLRRIKILEEMAQNLYREWFVKFRFPGHQHAHFTDSPLGRIPEGWEVNTVENTFAILGGGTPSKAVPEYWDEGIINWYSPTDLTAAGSMFMERSSNQISELGLKKSSARLFPPFSVMMTSRATLGVISINTTEACTNQGFITCVPNERFLLYTLYYWLKENVEYFISLGTGATFKEITKGVFKTIELVVPSQAIVTQFEDTVQQFALQVLNLQRKNTNLRRTRDLLLPRLISGEVDVSELDITVPEEVAA